MNTQRIVFAVVASLQLGCAMLVAQNTIPRWSAYLMVAGTVLQAFMRSVWTTPPADIAPTQKAP